VAADKIGDIKGCFTLQQPVGRNETYTIRSPAVARIADVLVLLVVIDLQGHPRSIIFYLI